MNHHHGDFILSGGGKDTEYYDLAPLLLEKQGLGLIKYKFYVLLHDSIGLTVDDFDAFACLELCPVPLIGSMITQIGKKGLIVRKAKKGHGTNKLIEGNIRKDDRVIIVEDVTSTGESVRSAINALEDEGCKIIAIITIINRQEGCDKLLEGYKFGWLFTKEELKDV